MIPANAKLVGSAAPAPVAPPPGTLPGPARRPVMSPKLKRVALAATYVLATLFFGFACMRFGAYLVDGGSVIPVPPAPVSGNLWVSLVYDPESPTQEFAHIEADQSLAEFVRSHNGRLRVFAKDSATVKNNNLYQFVDKFGLPTLIVQAEGTTKVLAEKCPDTAGKIIEEIKKYAGIK